MIKLAQEDLEKLVIFMRECGDKLGKATTDLDLLESKTKELEKTLVVQTYKTLCFEDTSAAWCVRTPTLLGP